ncbi:hypothetical protein Tco_0775044 [Tanacetum coccineum]
MFDRAFKRVNTFFNFRTDLVEGSSKRAREELEQAGTKRQKVDDDKETTELQSLIEVILDEEEGRIVRIKSLLNAAGITAALIDVNAPQSKLYKVNVAEGVNAASEEVSTAELVMGSTPTQVNKITTSCEICSGPHDTQYCMESLEQACVDYTSLRTNEMGGKRITPNQGPRNFNNAAKKLEEKANIQLGTYQIRH